MVSVIDDICDVLGIGVLEFKHPGAPFLVWHGDINFADEVIDDFKVLRGGGYHERVEACIGDNVDFALDAESGVTTRFTARSGPPRSFPICARAAAFKKVLEARREGIGNGILQVIDFDFRLRLLLVQRVDNFINDREIPRVGCNDDNVQPVVPRDSHVPDDALVFKALFLPKRAEFRPVPRVCPAGVPIAFAGDYLLQYGCNIFGGGVLEAKYPNYGSQTRRDV